MKMKSRNYQKILWLSLAMGLLLTSVTWASDKIGNGGGGWVCRDTNNRIVWVELLDLFEARAEYGLDLQTSRLGYEAIVEQMDQRFGRIAPINQSKARPYLNALNYLRPTLGRVVHTNDVLEIVGDSFHRLRPGPERCAGKISYEQIVNYKHDGQVLVQAELFARLSEIARAALVTHEAGYAYMRATRSVPDSVAVRRAVGILYSTLSDDAARAELSKFIKSGARDQWPFRYGDVGGRPVSYRKYLAVAFDHSQDLLGAAWDFSSVDEAKNAAIRQCGSPGCAAVLWTNDACGAYAVHPTEPRGFYAFGKFRSEAETVAVQKCRDFYGVPCLLAVSLCNNP